MTKDTERSVTAPPRRAPRTPAVLVSVWLPTQTEAEHLASLAEMQRLMHTLGLDVVAIVTQRRSGVGAATVVGGGKLRELADLTGGDGVVPSGATVKRRKAGPHAVVEEPEPDEPEPGEDGPAADGAEKPAPVAKLVVVDNEISPSQMRNLERATSAEVLDRASVIIEIFHRHAHTREARLQVEIARLAYEAPRLREKPSTGDRQRGGGVGGPGESDLELDRRRIRDRLAELRRELVTIARTDGTRRTRRHEQQRVALVGYTNAGKSSLMRALTGSHVLVADQLFATLGTTVRALEPATHPRILVSDTVGFIKNLPHDLVASFRSTLEEAHDASLLLLVVDAADPDFRAQLAVTRQVLSEIEADRIAQRVVLNKRDRLTAEQAAALAIEFPDALLVSALAPADARSLRDFVLEFFERDMEEATLIVPYRVKGVLGDLREHARVLHETYDEQGAHLTLRAPRAVLARLRTTIGETPCVSS